MVPGHGPQSEVSESLRVPEVVVWASVGDLCVSLLEVSVGVSGRGLCGEMQQQSSCQATCPPGPSLPWAGS